MREALQGNRDNERETVRKGDVIVKVKQRMKKSRGW